VLFPEQKVHIGVFRTFAHYPGYSPRKEPLSVRFSQEMHEREGPEGLRKALKHGKTGNNPGLYPEV